MAGPLITIEKGKATAQCERFQLEAMEAKGWRVAPPPKVDRHGNPLEVEPAANMFEVVKGDQVGWCDEKTFASIEKAGWERGAQVIEQTAASVDPSQEASKEQLAEILSGLDPQDDDLWTKAGTLRIDAFNEMFGLSETRASIDALWPDFSRDELARALSEE